MNKRAAALELGRLQPEEKIPASHIVRTGGGAADAGNSGKLAKPSMTRHFCRSDGTGRDGMLVVDVSKPLR